MWKADIARKSLVLSRLGYGRGLDWTDLGTISYGPRVDLYQPWHHLVRTLEASWTDLGSTPYGPWHDLDRPWHRLLRTSGRSARSWASSDTNLGGTGLNLGINRDAPWRIPHQPRGVLYKPRLGLDGELCPGCSSRDALRAGAGQLCGGRTFCPPGRWEEREMSFALPLSPRIGKWTEYPLRNGA